ncbi:RES family NAD+ phosphorylase [Halomonas sp. SpR8]|uniref:RES family NAD+ phosphorylase n=1 Tax=Halomonas sp. SpR8 TaxID=3050463 RepID=UPI0027E50A8D|nr:RES family NAD+ phosphorylase [Halomonas sp. SpR8]MDQ7729820.1 RES family NAD+ phosphorylase [Halomonas sp. SpR8]
MILDDCEEIFHQALSSESETAFRNAIDPLFKEYEILSLEFGRGSMFWRARLIESEMYPNISDLDYPPPELTRQGRLNDPGAPCFYISARKETALAEVGATEGQLVQLAGFRIKNESPIRLAVIGEYSNVQKSGYMHFAGRDPEMAISKILNAMPRQQSLKKLYIDKFFASILSNPDASANGYMFSRALARAIYSRVGAGGIVFPSVKDRGGFNLAVQAEPSDKSFQNVSCLVVRMGKPRRFGLIEFTIVKSAERLDEDWNFIWLEGGDPEAIGMYNMSKEEFEMASRNPSDRNNLLHMLHTHAGRR